MDDAPRDEEMVTIRCPSCGQRFKVGPDLDGKMVECGTCEHRFRVGESVMVRTKKFYPGEQKDRSLQRFSRVPLQSVPTPEFEAVDPPPEPDGRNTVEPISPARVVVGLAGVAAAVMVGLLLIFGTGMGGILEGVSLQKRLVLAGFAGVLASVMLMVANPRQRLRAGAGGVAILMILVSLPFLFTGGYSVTDEDVAQAGTIPLDQNDEVVVPVDPFAELKEEVGYGKVEEALEKYGIDGEIDGKTAVGIWLRDTRLYNKEQIVDYLMRATDAGPQSWTYSRPPTDYLTVLHDVTSDLGRLQKICERFGRVSRVVRELHLIEVVVDNESFQQGPVKKLQDANDPDFYELNLRELNSIDLNRAEAAVKRLAIAEPKLFRSDIVSRMLEVYQEGDVDMKEHVARALLNWAEPDDNASEVVRKGLAQALEANDRVPNVIVECLVRFGDTASVPLIHQLWVEDASEWESLYGDMGKAIEEPVLREIESYSPLQLISAARLLGRVGTERSLPVLEAAQEGAPSELRVTLEKAIRSIESRQTEG
jgi:hypothetical protein